MDHYKLNPTERAILACIADGLTNAEIAARVCVSDTSVSTLISRLYDKLGIPRERAGRSTEKRIQAIRAYLQGGAR